MCRNALELLIVSLGCRNLSVFHRLKRLADDTVREANTDEVVDLKKENTDLKQAVAELYLRNDWLKKSLTGQGVILDEK